MIGARSAPPSAFPLAEQLIVTHVHRFDSARLSRAATAALAFLALAAPALAPSARASFIESLGQGSRAIGMGNAFIGVADDLTANYYNPAGLTQLIGGAKSDSMFTSSFVALQLHYREPVVEERSRVGVNEKIEMDDEFPSWAAEPTAPFGLEIGDRLYVVPFPIQIPFAGSVQFPFSRGDARYSAAEVGQIFVTWSPSMAIKANDWLSVGVGFDLMVATDVWQKAAIGDGAVCEDLQGATGGLIPCNKPVEQGGFGTRNGVDDGYTLLRAAQEFRTGLSPVNDVNLDLRTPGFHAGVMVFPREDLRIGAVYRSALTPTIPGRLESHFEEAITRPGGTYNGALLYLPEDASRFELRFPLPQQVGAGFSYDISDQWMVALDWTWVDWDGARNKDVIKIKNPDGLSPITILPEGLGGLPLGPITVPGFQTLLIPRDGWTSTHSLRGGVEWQPIEGLRVDAGIWWDPTPTPDSDFTPDSDPGDRLVYSGAIGYYGLMDGMIDIAGHLQWITIETRHIAVGESRNLGGSISLPAITLGEDTSGEPSYPFYPNDTFAMDFGGRIINWGLTLTIHL